MKNIEKNRVKSEKRQKMSFFGARWGRAQRLTALARSVIIRFNYIIPS
jgi:hypothetical protein